MQLEQLSDGPIQLGTRIRRTNVRFGTPVEGEMEVVEWEPDRALSMAIHDANMEMTGRTTFESDGPNRTVVTITTEMPNLDASMADVVKSRMQRTIDNVKSLIESDDR